MGRGQPHLRFFTFGDDHRLDPHKRRLFTKMRGATLMVAAGTGNNFRFFPPGQSIIAIDITPKMLERAAKKAAAYNGRARDESGSIQTISRLIDEHGVMKPAFVRLNRKSSAVLWCGNCDRYLLHDRGQSLGGHEAWNPR